MRFVVRRFVVRLKSLSDYAYDLIYHHNLQGFVYVLLRVILFVNQGNGSK
jgi:hypothetical protein